MTANRILLIAGIACGLPSTVLAADLAGHNLLVTSVLTGDTEVFIADPTTGDMVNVSRSHKSEDRYPCWSPDGKQICADEQIVGEAHDPTLSPDGQRITYTGHEGGGVTVFVMNHDGSHKRQVVKEISKVGATFPNWSPDSKQLVYSFPAGDALELFVINSDGTDKRPVWVIRPDGTHAQVIESLRYQMAIDGSRASWKPQ